MGKISKNNGKNIKKRYVKTDGNDGVPVLTLKHLGSAFLAYAIGIGLSLVVFGIEMFHSVTRRSNK